jgi:YD repeat-containing protein
VRLKSIAIPAVALCALASVRLTAAVPPHSACDLPRGLQREIAAKYPGAKLISLSDVQEDDKGLFQKDHGNACPGLVKVDNNGNTTGKTDSTGTTSYTWDFENRLTSVTLPGSGGTVSFKYDPLRRRVYKSSSGGHPFSVMTATISLKKLAQLAVWRHVTRKLKTKVSPSDAVERRLDFVQF